MSLGNSHIFFVCFECFEPTACEFLLYFPAIPHCFLGLPTYKEVLWTFKEQFLICFVELPYLLSGGLSLLFQGWCLLRKYWFSFWQFPVWLSRFPLYLFRKSPSCFLSLALLITPPSLLGSFLFLINSVSYMGIPLCLQGIPYCAFNEFSLLIPAVPQCYLESPVFFPEFIYCLSFPRGFILLFYLL